MVPPAVVSAEPRFQQGPFAYGYVNPQQMMGMSPFHFSTHPYVNAFQQQQQHQGFIGAQAQAHWSPRHQQAAKHDHLGKVAKTSSVAGGGVGLVGSEQRPLSEKETKELKRKKANRESARRSKLRKKEEFESLAKKVDLLTSKGLSLRTEIAKMEGVLETLSSQNQALRKEVLATRGNLECIESFELEEKAEGQTRGSRQAARKETGCAAAQKLDKAMCKHVLESKDTCGSVSTATDVTSSDCTNEIHTGLGSASRKDKERGARQDQSTMNAANNNDSGGESDDMNCTVRIK